MTQAAEEAAARSGIDHKNQPGFAEVTAGLQAGEVVATTGSFRLKSLWLRARAGGGE